MPPPPPRKFLTNRCSEIDSEAFWRYHSKVISTCTEYSRVMLKFGCENFFGGGGGGGGGGYPTPSPPPPLHEPLCSLSPDNVSTHTSWQDFIVHVPRVQNT